MKKKLFITGIGGLTGYKLSLLAKKDYDTYGSYNLRDPNLEHVSAVKINLADFDKAKEILRDIHPDVLINTAAISNVDYCETHKKEAEIVNVKVIDHLYQVCNSLGIKLVHISSDSVFDGIKKDPYSEEDEPNPINYYGQTKLSSEKVALQNQNNLVVRSSVLYGWLPKFLADKSSSSMKAINFGQWLILKLVAKENVKIVTDEISTPIIADDLARAILHLVERDKVGIFHCAPLIQINRYDFSVKLAKFFNFDVGLIQPTTVKDLGRNVPTGLNKCLDSKKITKTTGFRFLTLEESLSLIKEQYLTE